MPWKQRRAAYYFYLNQRVGSRVVSAHLDGLYSECDFFTVTWPGVTGNGRP